MSDSSEINEAFSELMSCNPTIATGSCFGTTVRDGDGIPDVYEQAHSCLNPLVADATADPDGDGLANGQEYLIGTDPCRADTDGDLMPDGHEVAWPFVSTLSARPS